MAREIKYKVFESQVKAFDDERLILTHFISSERKDRGGDVMRMSGMMIDGKPVVMQAHGRGPMGTEPIAKPLDIGPGELDGKEGILATTQFFPDETGRRLYQKARDGFSPNWSVGYMVEEGKDLYENGVIAGYEITKWYLLEYSMVGVPMNPDASGAGGYVPARKGSEFDGAVCFKVMPGTDGEPDAGGAGGDAEPAKEAAAVASPDASDAPKGDPDPVVPKSEEPAEEDSDIKALTLKIDQLTGMIAALAETIVSSVKQTEPPTEPGEPAPGEKYESGSGKENPPEPEKSLPPRLVIVKDRPADPRRLSADALRGLVSTAVNQRLENEVNRLRGKVP